MVTKWTIACDKRLHRLICYIHHGQSFILLAYVGDTADKIKLVLFVDASFAGDINDSKSAGGAFLILIGPNTFVPISWICKKQGQISHSSTEAEVISLDAGLRLEGIPAISLWDEIIEMFCPNAEQVVRTVSQDKACGNAVQTMEEILSNVDFVPPSLPSHK